MARLPVFKYPSAVLKNVSKGVTEVNETIRDLVKDMFETMYLENGIGLAAPQVGEGIRLIVIDVPKIVEGKRDIESPDPLALINPEIISGSGQIQFEEGCLSCPELLVKVDRMQTIQVNYLDLDGQPRTIQTQDLKAVCIQHEIDHLNGVLLVDKVSRLERNIYKSKRIRIAKDEEDIIL